MGGLARAIGFVATAAALTSLAACGSADRSVGRRSTAGTTTRTITSPTGVRPARCRATQLSASVGESGPAAGTENVVLLLHNVSATPCWFGGLLPIAASVRRAPPVRLRFRASADPAVALVPTTGNGPGPLAPDHYGALIVSECLAEECSRKQPAYTTLHIEVDVGQVVSMPYPAVLRMGSPGTEGLAEPVPSPTGILGH